MKECTVKTEIIKNIARTSELPLLIRAIVPSRAEREASRCVFPIINYFGSYDISGEVVGNGGYVANTKSRCIPSIICELILKLPSCACFRILLLSFPLYSILLAFLLLFFSTSINYNFSFPHNSLLSHT